MNEKLTIRQLFGFYIGREESIRAVASTKGVFLLGCLFIVTAGLARNYDHHRLLSDPIWILGPFGMAFFSSLFIFGFVKWIGRIPAPTGENIRQPDRLGVKALENLAAWVSCFFLTAPLAWLYGVPYEMFLDVLTATKLNFATLLLVSFWRVFIMLRVIFVLFDLPPVRAFAAVLLPASAEMYFGSILSSLNIVGIMSGMRLSPEDRFLLDATSFVSAASVGVFIAAIIALVASWKKPHGMAWQPDALMTVGRSAWVFLAVALVGWLAVATMMQPKIENRDTLRSLVRQEDQAAVVSFISDKSPTDFPAGQDPFASYYHSLEKKEWLLSFAEKLPSWAVDHLQADVKNLRSEIGSET